MMIMIKEIMHFFKKVIANQMLKCQWEWMNSWCLHFFQCILFAIVFLYSEIENEKKRHFEPWWDALKKIIE